MKPLIYLFLEIEPSNRFQVETGSKSITMQLKLDLDPDPTWFCSKLNQFASLQMMEQGNLFKSFQTFSLTLYNKKPDSHDGK